MIATLAFDVYGTLIDTDSTSALVEKLAGEQAPALVSLWRMKQLEYSFRRGLMQHYADFSVCTADALNYACRAHGLSPSPQDIQDILQQYRRLPLYEDVVDGLARVKHAGLRTYAFSNGSVAAVEELLTTAGIRDYFDGVVSTEDLRSFKPNPAVYSHFLRKSGARGADAWLVSSNPFDVIGAVSFGMRAVWVKRSPEKIFDPWGIEPTVTISRLADLAERIQAHHS